MTATLGYWLFLAILATVQWLVPQGWRPGLLASAFTGFLLHRAPGPTVLMLLVSALVYQATSRGKIPGWINAGLIAGLSVWLGSYKLATGEGPATQPGQSGLLGVVPVGVSYLVFKLIHFVVERRRGTIPHPPPQDFFCYLFFLPMYTAGPIERLERFLARREPAFSHAALAEGLTRIIHGFIKKYAFAEGFMALLVDGLWWHVNETELPGATTSGLWMATVIAYVRIYLDFSAYSDLAIGSARMFGYRLMENFDWPILAANPSEYWRRWHISLSNWCQYYIYMPLLGVARSPYLPMFAAFVVMGLWHLVSWNRIGWATYNTLGIVVYMLWTRWHGKPRPGSFRASKGWQFASILLTQVFVLGSVVFFMNGESQTLAVSLSYLTKLAGLNLPAH